MVRYKKAIALIMAMVLCISYFPNFRPLEAEAITVNPNARTATVTQNQKNMVARADWYYGITWVAQQTVDGWSGTFYKGGTYRIPYGQPIYSGKYIGYYATFDEFLDAAGTPGSLFYTGRSWYEGTTAPYYVSDCSAFVSWAWGIDRTTTYYIPSVTTSFGYVTTNSATYTLQLGDALNNPAHVVMVTGLEYDSNGAITIIEITEQTPPQMKRSYYTPYQLYQKYKNYTIQRYYGDVPAAPGTQEETWIEKAAFDVMVYRDRNPDISNLSDADLKKHWLEHGIKEGRASSPVLDLGFYLNNNPDLKEAFGTDYEALYEHFITKGYKEYRKSSALFDGQYYCDAYPEVAANYKENYMLHYVDNGIKEGRRASLTFDADYYLFLRPDVAEAWPGDYEMAAKHYAGHGINAQIEAYDHTYPVISDATISDISATGYTVSCTVTDDWGIRSVAFPTWTLLNDQDDLPADFFTTQLGTRKGNTFTFRVNASDHNNEKGSYVTHIYATDKGGNRVQLALDSVEVKDPPQKLTLCNDSDFSISDSYLYNIPVNITANSILYEFTNEDLRIVDSDGAILSDSDFIGTGAQIQLYDNNILIDSATVILTGDVDGNGGIDTTDYLNIKRVFLGEESLLTHQALAADVDGNGVIDATDLLRIRAHFLGLFSLQ